MYSHLVIEHGVCSVVSESDSVVPEDVVGALARDRPSVSTVWLRLDALDAEPHCLLESLDVAVAHASAGRIGVGLQSEVSTHRDVGRRLAEVLEGDTAVVMEDVRPGRSVAPAFDALISYLDHGGESATAVYLHHGPFRRDIDNITRFIRDDRSLVHALDFCGDQHLAAPDVQLNQVSKLVAGRSALIHDVVDAAAERDQALFAHLAETRPRRRALLDRINDRLLPHLSPTELQALTTAARLGYWHRGLGDRAESTRPLSLRPWMIQLEAGWWWLRPMWREPLAKVLEPERRHHRVLTGHRIPVGRRRPTPVMIPPMSRSAPPDVEPFGSPPQRRRDDVVGSPAGDDHASVTLLPTPPREPSDQVGRTPRPAPQPAAARRPDGPTTRNATELVVRMLGTFEVSVAGQPIVRWHGRLGRSILAYLLLQQYCVSRDRLIDLFWPDADPLCAQNRLRVAVSSVRRSIRAVSDRHVVEFRDGNYRIARSCDVRVDVVEFEQRARDARRAEERHSTDEALTEYRRSLDCYRGDLLADMTHDDWTVLPREALRVAHLECLASAARLHLLRGEHGEALSLAWTIIADDPAREDAHRLIMRCHAERGEVHQARRQFDLCRRELHNVLGVEPSPATIELLRALDAVG
jgi:DNA-binding SARP family transcriptional activator